MITILTPQGTKHPNTYEKTVQIYSELYFKYFRLNIYNRNYICFTESIDRLKLINFQLKITDSISDKRLEFDIDKILSTLELIEREKNEFIH